MNTTPDIDAALAAVLERQAIQDLVVRTAILLDDENLAGWLALFDEDAQYELGAWSPEIRQAMSWWKADRAMLAKQLDEIAMHVRDPARRRHVLGGAQVDLAGDTATVVTPFSVYRTLPDGTTTLYLVGRYEDRLRRRCGQWLYTVHKAQVDTRVLDSFTHLPL